MLNEMADPVAVFHAAAEAVAREDWLAAALLCDPTSLEIFKEHLVQRVAPDTDVHPITVGELLRSQPDMPREVAEYQVALHERSWMPDAVLKREVPGVNDISSLRALPPAEVFAAYLSRNSFDNRVEQLREFRPIPLELEELVRTQPQPIARYSTLGAIHEGERTAYVVYRLDFQTPSNDIAEADDSGDSLVRLSEERSQYVMDLASGPPECATCRKQLDGSWRLVADHGFMGLGSIAFTIGYDDRVQDSEGDS